eukprot:160059_1
MLTLFSITTPTRTYFVMAQSKESKHRIESLNDAIHLFNQKEYQHAITKFKVALSETNHPHATALKGYIHGLIGLSYLRRKEIEDYPLAIHHFSTQIALEPQNNGAYMNRAVIYYRLGKYKEAEHDCQHVIGNEKQLKQRVQDATIFRGLARKNQEEMCVIL